MSAESDGSSVSHINMSMGAAWTIAPSTTKPCCVLRGFPFRDLGSLGTMRANG